MARPKNVVVVVGNQTLSVQPKALKSFLTAKAGGSEGSLSGKLVGDLPVNLSGLNQVTAESLLRSMFPEPVVEAETVPAGTVTVQG